MDFQPNSPPDFCPACGNLAETHRVGGPDSRVLLPRKYCSQHSRVPAGFRRLLKRLFDAAEHTAAGRAFMDADAARLESGLRHFCSEACGGGKLGGVIRDRDIKGWTLRTLGLSAEDAAVQLVVSARCVQAWRTPAAI